tara:strand:+ start:88 stop:726 length:639 start_codon:yes stop_codon:yes gene_type:complete
MLNTVISIDNVLDIVCENLNIKDLKCANISFPNNICEKNIIKNKIKYNENILKKYFTFLKKYLLVYKHFEKSFIPMGLIYNLPVLKFNKEFMGGTHYIDNILYCDLNSPIMVSRDCFNRPFISIRYKYSRNYAVLTVFQRYTDDTNQWNKAGDTSYPLMKCASCGFSKQDKNIFIKNLCRLLNNQQIIYRQYSSMWENENETITYSEIDCKL